MKKLENVKKEMFNLSTKQYLGGNLGSKVNRCWTMGKDGLYVPCHAKYD